MRSSDPQKLPTRVRPWAVAAAMLLGSAAAAQPDPFGEATRHLMAGRAQEALSVYESYLEADPQGSWAPLAATAAGNLRRDGLADLPGALACYQRVLDRHRDSDWASEAARRKAEVLAQQQAWAEAGASYREALDLAGAALEMERAEDAPGRVSAAWINEVSLAAANCFYELGDRRAVIDTYERALARPLPPESRAATLYRLGECCEEGGDVDRAAHHYHELLENLPLAPEARQAREKRALIEPRVPLDWIAQDAFAAAIGALRQRDFAAALEHCATLEGSEAGPTLRLYGEYSRIVAETIPSGDYTAGARRLRNLLRRLPRGAVPANLEQAAEQYELTAAMEAEARRTPDDAATVAQLGQRYQQAGSLEAAARTLERALELDPANDQVRFALGTTYAQSGDPQRAAAAYEAYLERHPDDLQALNLIGYAWLNIDPARAVGYFQRYAELAPDDPNAHDSLGEGLLAAGRMEEAAAEYERALAIDPTFSNSCFMLGSVCQQLDRPSRAKEAYQRFLDLTGGADPRTGQAQAALRELDAAPSPAPAAAGQDGR